MIDDDAVQPLVELGFTDLEARVYLCLLQRSPLTGYAVAKQIGKPTANTYQALESLARKQAVIIDDGESRMCRAVEPDQVLTSLERTFAHQRGKAQGVMSRMSRPSSDERVYQLRTPEQVWDRARSLIEAAETVIVADLFPLPLDRLREPLAAAARRGVLVCVHGYRPDAVDGVHFRSADDQAYTLDRMPGEHLALAADALQHLYALLERGGAGVRQAVWSESLYLSCMAHNHLATEFELSAARAQGRFEASELAVHLVRDALPGFARLARRPAEDGVDGP